MTSLSVHLERSIEETLTATGFTSVQAVRNSDAVRAVHQGIIRDYVNFIAQGARNPYGEKSESVLWLRSAVDGAMIDKALYDEEPYASTIAPSKKAKFDNKCVTAYNLRREEELRRCARAFGYKLDPVIAYERLSIGPKMERSFTKLTPVEKAFNTCTDAMHANEARLCALTFVCSHMPQDLFRAIEESKIEPIQLRLLHERRRCEGMRMSMAVALGGAALELIREELADDFSFDKTARMSIIEYGETDCKYPSGYATQTETDLRVDFLTRLGRPPKNLPKD
jgi:hypothetical protein